jgi:hypothetical protein
MLWRYDRKEKTTKHTGSKSLLDGVCAVAQTVVLFPSLWVRFRSKLVSFINDYCSWAI